MLLECCERGCEVDVEVARVEVEVDEVRGLLLGRAACAGDVGADVVEVGCSWVVRLVR